MRVLGYTWAGVSTADQRGRGIKSSSLQLVRRITLTRNLASTLHLRPAPSFRYYQQTPGAAMTDGRNLHRMMNLSKIPGVRVSLPRRGVEGSSELSNKKSKGSRIPPARDAGSVGFAF